MKKKNKQTKQLEKIKLRKMIGILIFFLSIMFLIKYFAVIREYPLAIMVLSSAVLSSASFSYILSLEEMERHIKKNGGKKWQ